LALKCLGVSSSFIMIPLVMLITLGILSF